MAKTHNFPSEIFKLNPSGVGTMSEGWYPSQGEILKGSETEAHQQVIQHQKWKNINFYMLPHFSSIRLSTDGQKQQLM